MISPDCEKCEYLDIENKACPCSLEETIRCNILHKYVKKETLKVQYEL